MANSFDAVHNSAYRETLPLKALLELSGNLSLLQPPRGSEPAAYVAAARQFCKIAADIAARRRAGAIPEGEN